MQYFALLRTRDSRPRKKMAIRTAKLSFRRCRCEKRRIACTALSMVVWLLGCGSVGLGMVG